MIRERRPDLVLLDIGTDGCLTKRMVGVDLANLADETLHGGRPISNHIAKLRTKVAFSLARESCMDGGSGKPRARGNDSPTATFASSYPSPRDTPVTGWVSWI